MAWDTLKFVHKDPTDNMLALVQVMAWCQTGHKLTWRNNELMFIYACKLH